MEQPNPTRFETERSALVKLFDDGKFKEAKASADQLVQNGYPETLVCRSLYDSFRKLEQKVANKAAYVFRDYKFQCWLSNNQDNNLK